MNEIFEKPDLKGVNPYDYLLNYFTGDPYTMPNPVWWRNEITVLLVAFLKRRWRNEPFALDDRVCATDGNAIIFFDKSLSKETYKPIEGKDKDDVLGFLQFQQNQLFVFPIDLLKTALEHCPVINHTEEMPCGCGGEEMFFCPECWGSGIKHVLSNKQGYNMESVIIFKGTHFFAIKILEIYKAALVLGVETIQFLYAKGPDKPHYFKIGDVTLLMMPMMINGNESEIVYEIS